MSAIKDFARSIRNRVRYFIKRCGKEDLRVNAPYEQIGNSAYHSFIGYYDIQPFSENEREVLIGRCNSSHNGRAMDVPLEIGIYNLEKKSFHKIGMTQLWCWQQGCRLQWVRWRGKSAILYNVLDKGAPATVIYDPVSSEQMAVLPLATYCISQDGQYIASLDFDTLERCRPGYGYDWKTEASNEEMSIIIYDTISGESRTILSVQTALAVNPHETMAADGAVHYFNHLHFNPSATRLMVFHIWEVHGKRRVRALTMDMNGGNIADVTGGEHVSHYCWAGDEKLVFYGTDPKCGMGFHTYKQSGGHVRHWTKELPKGDGHPTLSPRSTHWMLSDSLVNRDYERDLWLYDLNREKRIDLAHFNSPPRYSGAIRCDLHPRWSPKGNRIAVDTAHAGFRQVVILNVSDIVDK